MNATCDAMYVHVSCNLCNADDSEVYAVQLGSVHEDLIHARRVRCRRCGLVYSGPQATPSRLAEFYSNRYPRLLDFDRASEQLSRHHEAFFRWLTARRGAGRFLDVGCATGRLLRVGRDFGWCTYGVELSEEFSAFARQQHRLTHIFTGELHGAGFEADFFDFIQLWHTLEHVSDATATLREAARILKPDGELSIGVPSIAEPYNWLAISLAKLKGQIPGMFTSDHHTHEFTPKTLKQILAKTGFAVSQMRVYYNPGAHTPSQTDNWKSRVEKCVVGCLAKMMRGRLGNRIDVVAVRRIP